jgi:small subunit ribosomal protein S2
LVTYTIKDLLEAGVHFGHQAPRWNPKMKKYIFDERDGIHIIDLHKTVKCLDAALAEVRKMAEAGEEFLFVGTKKQAADLVKEEAERSTMHFVTERWLGGMLTNFATIQRSVRRLKDLEKMAVDSYQGYTKKEALGLEHERAKMDKVLRGVKNMHRLPGMLFVVDCKKEKLAIDEANRLDIPVVALVDTNVDPDPITHPIPANDDALRSIKLITYLVTEAILEGRAKYQKELETQAQEGPKGPSAAAAGKPVRHLTDHKPRTGSGRPGEPRRSGDRPSRPRLSRPAGPRGPRPSPAEGLRPAGRPVPAEGLRPATKPGEPKETQGSGGEPEGGTSSS